MRPISKYGLPAILVVAGMARASLCADEVTPVGADCPPVPVPVRVHPPFGGLDCPPGMEAESQDAQSGGEDMNALPDGGVPATGAPGQALPLGAASAFAGSRDVSSAPQSVAPYMLGDQSGGGCGGLNFDGALRVLLEHPTFGCSRLNIAENNSPQPRDRFSFRYNHFHNITETDVFSDSPGGAAADINIDRFTFALEKTFFNGATSLEVRIPFARELTSDIVVTDNQGVTNLPVDDVATEFGNVSLLGKLTVWSRPKVLLSTGVGLNIPTSENVNIAANINNDNFLISPLGAEEIRTATLADFSGFVTNSTYNLSPFLAALWTPTSRLFAQGFMQLDLPLNPSTAAFSGTIILPDVGFTSRLPEASGDLYQQVLLRLNIGAGYWLLRRPEARFITGIAPTIEAHYTTTLDDAQTLSDTVTFFDDGDQQFSTQLIVGNLSNRVDVTNLVLGNTVEIRNDLTIATGFVIPIVTGCGCNRPFDFEFNLQVNANF